MMFTDIVGYSSMVGKDEKRALKLLAEHDDIIEPIIEKHKGTIIKKIGDAIFAEFPKSSNAAKASIDIQTHLRQRNELNRKNNLINIRIGLHEGSVIEKDSDLFGNDVNLCSRIEGSAPPGGIAISALFYKSINKLLNIYAREIGHVVLKNISKPQQLYKLYIDKKDLELESSKELNKLMKQRGLNIINPDTYKEKKAISITFLPLNNMGAEDTAYTSYQLTKEIIEELKSIEGIRCPSFSEDLTLEKTEVSISDIARQLKVDNVVKGAIFIKNDTIKMDLNMVDINSGDTYWKKEFSGNINSVNKFKGKIISSILDEFNLDLPERIKRLLQKELSENPKSYRSYLKGKYILDCSKSPDRLEEAKKLFHTAFTEDESFPEAYSQYGLCCNKLGNIDEGRKFLNKGIEIAEHNKDEQSMAIAYNCMGISYINWHSPKEALEYYEKALKLQVSLENRIEEAKIKQNMAVPYNIMNMPEKGIDFLQKAIEILDNYDEPWLLGMCYGNMGNSYLIAYEFSDAIINYEKALAIFTREDMDNARGKVLLQLSRSYIWLGLLEEGSKFLDEAFEVCSIFDEPIVMANLHWFSAWLMYNYNNNEKAISDYKEAIELAQMAESYITTSDTLKELAYIYMQDGKLKEARKLITKCLSINKKINNELMIEHCNLMLTFIEICEKKITSTAKIDKSYKKGIELEVDYLYWHNLAWCYFQLDEKSKVKDCLKRSHDDFFDLQSYISNKKHAESFKNNNRYCQFIFDELTKYSLESNQQDNKPKLSFCPNCGTPMNNSKFCSNCGHKLF